MKKHLCLLWLILILSCNNERIVKLPEIENAEVTEVLDVSPAYIFYDKTQPDSTLLNRKNLISTTNWLVNVDKRLTLRQAIPHIQFLQEKRKKASMHKNENAKNYFTCNDKSIGTLGFLEFTDLNYEFSEPLNNFITLQKLLAEDSILNITAPNDLLHIPIDINSKNKTNIENDIISFAELLKNSTLISEEMKITEFSITLCFDGNLSFQDYILLKSKLSKLDNDSIMIDTNEFIY